MEYSRRDLALLPLFAAAAATSAAAGTPLTSNTYRFEDLPVKTNGQNRSRAILNGETHSRFPLQMHLTELAARQAPHPPHHHLHEEIIMIVRDTLQVHISAR